jgi:hypothetical protein
MTCPKNVSFDPDYNHDFQKITSGSEQIEKSGSNNLGNKPFIENRLSAGFPSPKLSDE